MRIFCCLYLLLVCRLAATAETSGSNGCILPAYPAHGKYTVHDRPDAQPGQAFDLAILMVTCDPGYGVVGNNATYCFSNNNWLPMPQCTRFCTLTPDPSVTFLCKVTGDGIVSGIRRCHELEPHGTVVVPECNRPVYYSDSALLNMRCSEGTWDNIATCQPDCGTSIPKGEQLVTDNTRVEHGDLAWHAAIYDKTYKPYMQICGGSLVSTKVVISAAHCFWKDELQPASKYAVALGQIYRPWDDPMNHGAHKSDVKEIQISDHFVGRASHFQDDIALVILATPVVYNVYIRPVCLDLDEEFDRNQLQDSTLGTFPGWSVNSEDGRPSQLLLTGKLPYVDVRKCLDHLDYAARPYLTSDKFCVGRKDGGAVRKGDGGGGLVFPFVERGIRRYYLRGVASTVLDYNENTLTAFTHIQSHGNFIKGIVNL